MTLSEKAALKQGLREAMGKALRKLRERQPVPLQEVLARRVSMDARYWGSLERGERSLTLFNLWRLAMAVGITPSRLVLKIDREYRQLAPSSTPTRPFDAEFRHLENILDQMPTMKWLADRQQNCVYANRPLLDYLGCAYEDLAGQAGREFVHPEDCERQVAVIEKAYRRRQMYVSRFRVRRADGKYTWVVQQAAPQFTPEGAFIGLMGTMIPEPEV